MPYSALETKMWKYPSIAQATWHFLKVGEAPDRQDKLVPQQILSSRAYLSLLMNFSSCYYTKDLNLRNLYVYVH